MAMNLGKHVKSWIVNDHSNDTLAQEIEYNFPNLKALYERERELIS